MAKAATSKKEDAGPLQLMELQQSEMTFYLLGQKPLIFNRMAEKAKRDLLLGSSRKTAAERAVNLKHNPPEEFFNSVYRDNSPTGPTRLAFPAPGIKGSMMTAALEIPGARKSEVGRLVWVNEEKVNIFGVPELKMDVVRSADMNRTPDIRTRAVVRHWCCEVSLSFINAKLNAQSILNLISGAGLVSGIGDFRQEKGKGSYGQFRPVDPDNEMFVRIMKEGGRLAQDHALEHYTCYDEETEDLMQFFHSEVKRLGKDPNASSRSVPGVPVWDLKTDGPIPEGEIAAQANGKTRGRKANGSARA